MKKIYTVLLALFASINIYAQGIVFEQGTFSEALEKAQKENKLVFMDCYTTWCGPCKVLAKKVFPQQEAGDFFNNKFVSVKFDMEKGEGIELAKQYEVKAFPTLLFLDASGKVLHKIVGGTDLAGLIENAEIATDPSKQINALHKRYDEGERDVKFLSEYIQALVAAYEYEKVLPIGQDFLANTPKDQLINVEAFTVIGYSGAMEYESETYKYVIANKEKFIEAEGIGQEHYDGVVGQCVNRYLTKFASNNSLEELKSEIEKSKKDFVSPHQEMVERELIYTYYYSHKEFDNWYELKIDEAKEAMKTDTRMGSSILVQTAYRISMDHAFDEQHEIFEKAIVEVENYLQNDEGNLAGYYCLASLYKKTNNKEAALKNINSYIEKAREQELPDDPRITKLKEEIEKI